MIERISALPRYIVCSQVTKRPIFEFVCSNVRPNASLIVFALADDYSFGILQSAAHWDWFRAKCSTLKGDFRYTSNTVFDTFPWPQNPTTMDVEAVAVAAVELRIQRNEIMAKNEWSLRELYRSLDDPGKHPLRDSHEALDAAVAKAYRMPKTASTLAFLLNLNADLAARQQSKQRVVGPGLEAIGANYANAIPFSTSDCIAPR
jgi:hypothetical protein